MVKNLCEAENLLTKIGRKDEEIKIFLAYNGDIIIGFIKNRDTLDGINLYGKPCRHNPAHDRTEAYSLDNDAVLEFGKITIKIYKGDFTVEEN